MKNKLVKYIILVCILTLGVFVLAGCQSNENQNVENTNTENNTSETSLRDQIMGNSQANNAVTNTMSSTKLEDLEKYNKEEDSNYKTYKDSDGVSFMYPNNWMSIGKENEPAFMSVDGKGATVNISKDVMSEDTTVVTDFDSYMGFQKLYLMQQMTMLTDINEKKVNLNGKKAYILNYTTESEENEKTIQLNVTQVAFVDEGNKVYILTMATMDKYYKDYQAIFEKMAKSFMKE